MTIDKSCGFPSGYCQRAVAMVAFVQCTLIGFLVGNIKPTNLFWLGAVAYPECYHPHV